ncbi:MAG: ATPase, partial [Microcoleaceae cyanobacterium]
MKYNQTTISPVDMDVQKLVELTDRLVFAKTGKHLDSLQREVLKSTLLGKKYPEIAEDSRRKYNHVKQVGSDLWQLLEEVLKEEDIKQSNVRSILEKWHFSQISNFGECMQVGNINICEENRQSPTPNNKSSPTPTNQNQNNTNPENNYDLSEAPDLYSLCDRHTEITTLKQWINKNHTRIITILGLTGIGKSVLALQLIPQIKNKFDYIIWRNIDNY